VSLERDMGRDDDIARGVGTEGRIALSRWLALGDG
jgi:hypothetical protein